MQSNYQQKISNILINYQYNLRIKHHCRTSMEQFNEIFNQSLWFFDDAPQNFVQFCLRNLAISISICFCYPLLDFVTRCCSMARLLQARVQESVHFFLIQGSIVVGVKLLEYFVNFMNQAPLLFLGHHNRYYKYSSKSWQENFQAINPQLIMIFWHYESIYINCTSVICQFSLDQLYLSWYQKTEKNQSLKCCQSWALKQTGNNQRLSSILLRVKQKTRHKFEQCKIQTIKMQISLSKMIQLTETDYRFNIDESQRSELIHDKTMLSLNKNFDNFVFQIQQHSVMICQVYYASILQISITMGNAPDKTIDKSFMLQHSAFSDEFLGEEPLFHVEDIKFPLSTNRMKIVDATGRRVKLAGGNWSGAHMCRHCVDGLECRPLKDLAMDIRFKFKMNCIRLTYSLQLIVDNNVVPQKYIKANPDLKGKTALEIFDITVKTLTEVGLMVILNNHTSTSQWCCSLTDGDGLWWSRKYPEYLFFNHVRDFAKRYKDNERVIGMDMRNEIRKAHDIEPTWGDGNPRSDWKRAASISAEIALKEAPHWLILVGGINYQLDLTFIKDDPLTLSVPNKLVYTGHFYGFSWPIPSWAVYSYDNFKKRLFNTQTYVRTLGVPYLLGEFGNNNQDIPWKYLMQYLKETDIDWTYWALDGFKCDPDKDETFGVFTNDFSGARHPDLLQDMIDVGPPKKALDNYWSYLPGKDQKKQPVSHDHPLKEQKLQSKPHVYQESEFSQKKKVQNEKVGGYLPPSNNPQQHTQGKIQASGTYRYEDQINPPIVAFKSSALQEQNPAFRQQPQSQPVNYGNNQQQWQQNNQGNNPNFPPQGYHR